MTARQRRFLAINFRVGTRRDGYLVGPILVSTCDYRHFRYWDEPEDVALDNDDYEIVKHYPPGLTCDEAIRCFAHDFPLPADPAPSHPSPWSLPQRYAMTA